MPKKSKSSAEKAKIVHKKKAKENPLLNKTLSLVFLILALVLLIVPLHLPYSKQINKNPIVISKSLFSLQTGENVPVRILIPSASIDLPIVKAPVVNGYWELSENSASYGLGSGVPGQNGNTVIFAHARTGLFYNLKDVKVKDIVYVFSKNKWFRYRVNKITAVYPNDTTVIQPTKNQTLTLYTCTGFDDEKRLIVTAVPQN